MKTITEAEYRKVSRCSPWFDISHFTFDEVQEFLNRKGYDILILRGTASVIDKVSDGGGGMDSIGDPYEKEVEDIFAVKFEEILFIPQRFDSKLADRFKINNVFQKELKLNLLK